MNRVNPHATGLAIGLFLALFHAVWAIMIWVGMAQPFMDFILKLHMIGQFITVQPFNFGYAIMLIVITGIIGYVSGWVLGLIWNRYAVK